MFVGDLIVRKTDRVLTKGGDVVVCFPGAKILSQRQWKKSYTRVEQIIMSGILKVMGNRGQGFQNCRRLAINTLVQQICRENWICGDVLLEG